MIIPVGETKEPVLPVPDSIATTDAAAISPAVISAPVSTAAVTPAATEENKEEPLSLLGAAGSLRFSEVSWQTLTLNLQLPV